MAHDSNATINSICSRFYAWSRFRNQQTQQLYLFLKMYCNYVDMFPLVMCLSVQSGCWYSFVLCNCFRLCVVSRSSLCILILQGKVSLCARQVSNICFLTPFISTSPSYQFLSHNWFWGLANNWFRIVCTNSKLSRVWLTSLLVLPISQLVMEMYLK